ncbi:helix-turn-helix transcriptional regulator [Rhizobium sp. Pop5]|uniref:helix-turn-helix domain-containing protein n=1 Tax=Rhizobium sp. Pop5 TaxID=1223565 RepID=UPI00028386E2|nr:helix-turn-helix transcriptional regulator [Rhizobium sp. Pop5]EJZ17404.1 hypothetical protein RCCGEPOP_30899 [Rhizobium sp. Pop5]UVD59006.1 helix-turn-helix transcriptional regulator [Rhizobium sp. Pop5]
MQRLCQDHKTPWRKVYEKIGLSQAELARAMGCHRSKISRALGDDEGLIGGRDQLLLIKVARERAIELSADDMLPERR